MMDSGSILITGATGQQGGAVARELLARGYQVRGIAAMARLDETEEHFERMGGDYRSLKECLRGLG